METKFTGLWNNLAMLKERVFVGGEVQCCYLHSDDFTWIGKRLLEAMIAEHPELPQSAADVFGQAQLRDFGHGCIQKLFGKVKVHVSYELRLRGHIRIWYESEKIEELILF
jgi:hypothetical protein